MAPWFFAAELSLQGWARISTEFLGSSINVLQRISGYVSLVDVQETLYKLLRNSENIVGVDGTSWELMEPATSSENFKEAQGLPDELYG